MHIMDLLPERRHIDDQVSDHRQVTERCDCDMPMPLNFTTERGAAGQLLTAVYCHRTGPANRRAARITEGQPPVAFVLDANEGIEHGHPAPNIDPKLVRMAG